MWVHTYLLNVTVPGCLWGTEMEVEWMGRKLTSYYAYLLLHIFIVFSLKALYLFPYLSQFTGEETEARRL